MESRIKYWAERNKIEIFDLYCEEDIYHFAIKNEEIHMRQLIDLVDMCGTNDITIDAISNDEYTSSIWINMNIKNCI